LTASDLRTSCERELPRGVTLLEAVITVAILGILGTVIVLGFEASSRTGGETRRIDEAVATLARLRDASVRYNLGNRGDTSFTYKIGGTAGGVNPGRLSQLTSPIAPSSANSLNSCGLQFSAIQAPKWTRNFYSSPISSTTPFRVADGFFADDTLARYNPSGTPLHLSSTDLVTPGTLAIVMRNVSISDAQALQTRLEGDQSGGIFSIIRFAASGTAPITVYYHMAIHGC
jgi:type II secretory pathway pseudopilin PulG